MSGIDRITVIIPMLNEAQHVEQLVSDLAAQDFEGGLEVIVADGGSTDESVPRLGEAAERAGLSLKIIDNPARWVSQGLNACVREATGDLIVRLDCHSRYPADYLRLCASVSESTGAANVGGIVVPNGRTTMERAVACAMESPFGGIGWTRHQAADGPVEVDTVTFGAFRPDAFRLAGGFDESLQRNQDDEFNLRLRRHGGRIVLDPAIQVYYTPRGSLSAVFRQYFEYGRWKVPVMRRHRRILGVRSLAPIALVGSLAALAAAAPLSPRARVLLGVELGAYCALALSFGAASLHRRREPVRLLAPVVGTFFFFHLGYGLGVARGLVDRS